MIYERCIRLFQIYFGIICGKFRRIERCLGALGGRQLSSVIFRIQLIQLKHGKK